MTTDLTPSQFFDQEGKAASRIKAYFENKESDVIGGVIIILLGEQGAGKTIALWKKGEIDLKEGRSVFWRGQDTCQWLGLAAQGLPVTIWMHERIQNPEWYLTVDYGEEPEFVNPEDLPKLDAKIKWFEDPATVVNEHDKDRINVFYLPGAGSGQTHEQYWFLHKLCDLLEAQVKRTWKKRHITNLWDEVLEIHPMEQRKPLNEITERRLPSLEKDFRKAKINVAASAHNTSQVHYKLWQNHASSLVYMRGSIVKNQMHSHVEQPIISGLRRGHFVVPAGGGIEKDKFNLPTFAYERFPWLDEEQEMELQFDSDIPDNT